MARILIVEDELELLDVVKRFFTREGHEVYAARSRQEALSLAYKVMPDVAVLDVMLQEGPENDGSTGFDICHALRTELKFEGPVLFLTARAAEADKLMGFELGADDYITKPFSLLELKARVQAALRRWGGTVRTYQFEGVKVDIDNMQIQHDDGKIFKLSPKEQELLVYLIRGKQKVIPREELIQTIWGYSPNATTRTLDTHVTNLRRKLRDDASSPRFIKTYSGRGYKFIAGDSR